VKEWLTILTGDSLEQLQLLESESVQCCITSPPYCGLRDYGMPGQMGLEATPELYVEKMVALFREVRRVLKDDGTVWLNLGDSYAGGGNNRGNGSPLSDKQNSNRAAIGQVGNLRRGSGRADGIVTGESPRNRDGIGKVYGCKPKDLVGIPWMTAFALRSDGWYLRSDIIWAKNNPMPESVTDRPTRSHEYIFLLSKSQRYFYDHEAIKEQGSLREDDRPFGQRSNGDHHGQSERVYKPKADKQRGHSRRHDGFDDRWDQMERDEQCSGMRNKRDVWTVATAPYKEAHFATFPPELIKPCVMAGSKPGDTILDPLFGSGTTGMVALELGRKCIGIELNPAYVELANQRCTVTIGLPL